MHVVAPDTALFIQDHCLGFVDVLISNLYRSSTSSQNSLTNTLMESLGLNGCANMHGISASELS